MVILDINAYRKKFSYPTLPDLARLAAATAPQTKDKHLTEAAALILESVQRHVLAPDTYQDLAAKLDGVRVQLRTAEEQDCDGVLVTVKEAVEVLAAFEARRSERDRKTAENFSELSDLLRESFRYIQAGSEQSEIRLESFEEGLNQAIRSNYFPSLNGQLTGMLAYVRQEAKNKPSAHETRESV